MNVAVIGGHKCSRKVYKTAQLTGSLIAAEKWALVCGGGPGVMEAACKGAKSAGGLTVGILPSYDGAEANKFLDVKLPTGFGYARNILVARAADAIIAIDGEYGTLSEIAFALNPPRKLVVGLGTWDIKGVVKAVSPKEAVEFVKKYFRKNNNKKND